MKIAESLLYDLCKQKCSEDFFMLKEIDWEKEKQKSYQDILSVQLAAEYLTISVDMMYKLIQQKAVPYAKINGRLVCRKCDLHDWIGQQVFFPDVKKHESYEVKNA